MRNDFYAPSVDTENGVMGHMNPLMPRSQMLPSDIFTPTTDVSPHYGHNPQLDGVADAMGVFSVIDFLFPGR